MVADHGDWWLEAGTMSIDYLFGKRNGLFKSTSVYHNLPLKTLLI